MSDFEAPVAKKAPAKETKFEDVKQSEVKEKEKPQYPPEELMQIFDEMIFAGSYSEIVNLKNGKLKIGLRTRTTEEVEAITRVIDTTTANLMSTLAEKRSILNLHYALTAYQGRDLSTMKVEEKALFINKIPAPIVGALITALNKFDQKIYAATMEGEENF